MHIVALFWESRFSPLTLCIDLSKVPSGWWSFLLHGACILHPGFHTLLPVLVSVAFGWGPCFSKGDSSPVIHTSYQCSFFYSARGWSPPSLPHINPKWHLNGHQPTFWLPFTCNYNGSWPQSIYSTCIQICTFLWWHRGGGSQSKGAWLPAQQVWVSCDGNVCSHPTVCVILHEWQGRRDSWHPVLLNSVKCTDFIIYKAYGRLPKSYITF